MHLIEFGDKVKRYLPEDLSECSDVQYIELSTLIYMFQTNQIDYNDFRIHALYKLLNMKRVKSHVNDELKYSKIYQMSELIDSFFETNEEKQKVIKQYYIHNPIPKFRGAFRLFYGPDNDFENVTFGEYIDGLEAFINFDQTNEPDYLYELTAILYRKKSFSLKGFDREVYNKSSVKKRAKFFKNQHLGILYGVYLYFASFQKYITNAQVFVQGNEIDLSILFDQKADKSELPGLGMKGALLSMAESGVYGDKNGVRKTLLWDVLIRMYDVTKRSLDEEAAYKKAK